jgi:hypothetical protein
MLENIKRYYHTIKHLKLRQLVYGIYYRFRNLFFPFKIDDSAIPAKTNSLKFQDFIDHPASLLSERTFKFLNKKHYFKESVDWNFQKHGKLWTYHLTYFDFLHQPGMNQIEGVKLIKDFIRKQETIKDGMEPYPISLRGVNWIKFLSKHQVQDSEINKSLFSQYRLLCQRIEYHLMGNHLLENGISLLFGAFYFEDSDFLKKSKQILNEELEEQILADGAHFERSPMYHLILLHRLLDSFNLVSNNKDNGSYNTDLELLLLNKIKLMLNWLLEIRFDSGQIPACNDSTNKSPVDADDLLDDANRLGFNISTLTKNTYQSTGESGYRMVKHSNYELLMDFGKPGPDYIPGHAHCDIFSFVLHINKVPFVVDPGVSTYEESGTRMRERSTESHNTVMFDGVEQSDIWKAFRLGRRAQVEISDENEQLLSGYHDGFKEKEAIHQRTFRWNDRQILIEDVMDGVNNKESRAFIHFHPDRNVVADVDNITVDDKVTFKLDGAAGLRADYYQYAYDFNDTEQAQRIEIVFKEKLVTRIEISE